MQGEAHVKAAASASDSHAQLRAEPEVLTLFRALGERRAYLVEQIERWSSAEHPLREQVRRIAEKSDDGQHGYSERRLREMDADAAEAAAGWRQQLASLDKALAIGAREDPHERGLSLTQLRNLVNAERVHAEAAALKALVAWRKEPFNEELRRRAELRLQHLSGRWVDLVALDKADRDARAGQSRAAAKVAARLLARALRRPR